MMGQQKVITFTDAASSYVHQSDSPGASPNDKEVKLGEIKDVTITGISKQSESKALVEIGGSEYDFTPFGEVLAKSSPNDFKRPVSFPFTLYDNGWRMELGQ